MTNLNISTFGNQTLSEIIKEVKLFSKFKIKYYDDLISCTEEANNQGQLSIFFVNKLNKDHYSKIEKINFPIIQIIQDPKLKNVLSGELIENLSTPFNILDLEKKIILLLAKFEFIKSSLINLNEYIVNKNERKIKKNNLELQLTEKEINFLVLFANNKKPLTKDYILKNVWNYSSESDTHTVETHVHRLRKKILEKFGDNNFIKNNNNGYYI